MAEIEELPAAAITTDDEFLKTMNDIKKLLNIDTIDELKDKQAEILRTKIMDVLKYITSKMEEVPEGEVEEESEGAAGPSGEEGEAASEEPLLAAPAAAPAGTNLMAMRNPGQISDTSFESSGEMRGGIRGKKKHHSRKQKGGTSMDLARITNTSEDGLKTTKDPYDSVMFNPEVAIGLNTHRAFTSGNTQGFSSISGLANSEVTPMLPPYGSQSGGSRKMKKCKSKK